MLLFNAIKWIGAMYLIYLGVKALCTKKRTLANLNGTVERGSRDLTTSAAFRIGLLTNVLNPKCAMFFVSFFSIVIKGTFERFSLWLDRITGAILIILGIKIALYHPKVIFAATLYHEPYPHSPAGFFLLQKGIS